MSEKTKLQKPVEDILNHFDIKFVHIRNYRKKNTPKELKGFPDLIIFFRNGETIAMEFKVNYNKLSEEQIEWKDYFEKNGYEYYEIRELNDAIKIINECRK